MFTDRLDEYNRYDREQRAAVIAHYGGKCDCCGENRLEFLAIDHISGGGKKHLANIRMSIYRWLTRNGYPPGFRVLCHNCNLSMGFYRYCPHQGLEAAAKARLDFELARFVRRVLNEASRALPLDPK